MTAANAFLWRSRSFDQFGIPSGAILAAKLFDRSSGDEITLGTNTSQSAKGLKIFVGTRRENGKRQLSAKAALSIRVPYLSDQRRKKHLVGYFQRKSRFLRFLILALRRIAFRRFLTWVNHRWILWRPFLVVLLCTDCQRQTNCNGKCEENLLYNSPDFDSFLSSLNLTHGGKAEDASTLWLGNPDATHSIRRVRPDFGWKH
jgi:hypothetical protein